MSWAQFQIFPAPLTAYPVDSGASDPTRFRLSAAQLSQLQDNAFVNLPTGWTLARRDEVTMNEGGVVTTPHGFQLFRTDRHDPLNQDGGYWVQGDVDQYGNFSGVRQTISQDTGLMYALAPLAIFGLGMLLPGIAATAGGATIGAGGLAAGGGAAAGEGAIAAGGLSKAALDGTTAFGANSVPGAFDVSAWGNSVGTVTETANGMLEQSTTTGATAGGGSNVSLGTIRSAVSAVSSLAGAGRGQARQGGARPPATSSTSTSGAAAPRASGQGGSLLWPIALALGALVLLKA